MITTSKEGVVILRRGDEIVGMIIKDLGLSRKNIFYSASEMSLEEIEGLFKDETNLKIM